MFSLGASDVALLEHAVHFRPRAVEALAAWLVDSRVYLAFCVAAYDDGGDMRDGSQTPYFGAPTPM